MTRKKSNVKALALAVTCAILAGGYSGLNPVYAAADKLYKESTGNVTITASTSSGSSTVNNTAITELEIAGVRIGTKTATGGSTAEAGRIEAKNIKVSQYLTVGTQLAVPKIVGTTAGGTVEVNGVKFASGAAITASSLKLGDMSDVAATINSKAAQTDVETNKNSIADLKTNKANKADVYTKEQSNNTFAGKDYEGKVNTLETTVGSDSSGLVKDVKALEDKTKNIKVANDTMIASAPATYIEGITHAGGVRLADEKVRAKEMVLEEKFANGTFAEAKLTREGLAALNSMVYDSNGKINIVDEKPIIQAGNGSVVGGVKLDNKNITNVDSITVNEGKENQVQITSEGIVVGLTSAAINGDGFYAGGHNYNDAKAALDGKDGKIKGAGGKFGVDEYGNVTTTANIKGKDIIAEGNLTVDGDAEVKKDLKVTGNITGADITANGALKGKTLGIGATGSEFTVDTVGNVKANGITTSDTTTNKIGGVTLAGSDINAKNLTLTGTLTAAKYNATDIEATHSIKVGATIMTSGNLDLGSNGTVDFGANELNDAQVGNINNVIQSGGVVQAKDGSVIGGVSFSAKDITGVKDLTATGKVTAATITDGTASLSGGALTGLASVNIGGNTTINSTGIETNKLIVGSGSNATTIDDANGVVSAKGVIGAVKFSGSGKLDDVTAIDGVSVAQNSGSPAGGLTFGNNAIIGATGIPFQSTGFKVDDDGDVEGKTFTTAADGDGNRSTLASGSLTIDANNTWTKDAGIIASNVKVGSNELKNDGLHVGTNTTVKDGVLTVGAGNTWSMTNGITASKAGIHGVTIGETEGKAVFNKAGKATTIDGDKITTGTITADELNVDKISLGKGTDKNITIGSNGDVTTKGDIKITDAAGNVMSKLSQDQATFGKDVGNQTNINKGKLNAKAKNTANQQAEFNFDENGLTVSGQNVAGVSSFSFNAKTGANTFTGQDGTTTAIKGSAITSTNGTATGVLDGSNLTLTNGANSTVMNAGGATFTGAAGRSTTAGTETTIDGGIITTDTLNVQRIELGEKLVDSTTGETITNSKIYLNNDGSFGAAKGAFQIDTDGQVTNKIIETGTDASETTFTSSKTGITAKYRKGTGTDSGLTIEDNHAALKASGGAALDLKDKTAKIGSGTDSLTTYTSDAIESKVGDTTVKTKDGSFSVKGNAGNGMDINTNTGKTTFTGSDYNGGASGTTTIDGNTITTGKLVTDKLVIKGNGSGDTSGDGGESGSIAFGGDGTITSNIKDGAKETTFKTTADGVSSEVTNGTYTSNVDQTATSIGSVITNGTVKIGSVADASLGVLQNGAGTVDAVGDTVTEASQAFSKDGSITSVAKNADGKSSQLVQNGTGLVYTDSANTGNATRINSSDVSIGSATDDSDRINLSDLGQIDDLDGELTARSEYTGNPTAVGGINAEAAIRREEVARLDNRIDDVNNRVDKVGAMAAAIASLKSIGYDPQAPSEFSIGLGQYKGETGVAMGFFHYPNKNFMINVSLSTAGGETMGGIGATWRFGHKSPQKLLDEQREAQAKKELAAAEKYQAAAKLAKEAQERAEYAAKLARQAQVSADNAKAAADATQAKHFQ